MSIMDTTCAAGFVAVTVSNGTSLSPAVNLYGLRLFGIIMPSAWTTASLTFQMSPDGGTSWYNMFDYNGNEISVTAVAGNCAMLDPKYFASAQMIKVRSGTSASPVTQGADRALQLIARAI